MKISERGRLFVNVCCTVEQFAVLIGAVWLIGWKDWSPWWMLFAVYLVNGSAPGKTIKALEGLNGQT